VYLVDFAQTTLEPVPDRSAHADVPQSEDVATTMAGRAFVDQRASIAERPDGARVWVPMIEGSDRTGVLALTGPSRNRCDHRRLRGAWAIRGLPDRDPDSRH
jgi:hypothetical protein